MPNMKDIISCQNKSILQKETMPTEEDTCNCMTKSTCPLDGKCQAAGVVYQATVTRKDNHHDETYVGLADTSFKLRYNNHTYSFREKAMRSKTTLSQYIWSLKDKNIGYSVKWKILARGRSYSTNTGKCSLCLKEKYFIICRPTLASLNKRDELISKCRHRNNHLLSNFG